MASSTYQTMKFITLLSLFALSAAYTHLDDTLDFKELVSNPTGLEMFIHCLLDKIPCYEPVHGYKEVVAEAIEGECHKCTDYQKYTLYTFLTGMQKVFPHEYEDFKAKYDPEDVHLKRTLPTISKFKDYE